MLLTDYFYPNPDRTWEIALQCGVKHGTIRLPEDKDYDVTDLNQLKAVTDRFLSYGIKPIIVEPLPNELHDHIKLGDEKRDECIEKFITLMKNLNEVDIGTVCFNFMAHYGWTRTDTDLPERGGAQVTGFDLSHFRDDGMVLTQDEIWKNYFYFIRAVLPYAEKYGIRLALHPDDPPLPELGKVGRVMINLNNIKRAINEIPSPNLGVTFCQACYYIMGEDMENAVRELKDKIFFVHFRNVTGNKENFRETFHDNGQLDMAKMMSIYHKYNVDVPIRVDHVPTLSFENKEKAGYDALGRLYAIGYLRGLIEAECKH